MHGDSDRPFRRPELGGARGVRRAPCTAVQRVGQDGEDAGSAAFVPLSFQLLRRAREELERTSSRESALRRGRACECGSVPIRVEPVACLVERDKPMTAASLLRALGATRTREIVAQRTDQVIPKASLSRIRAAEGPRKQALAQVTVLALTGLEQRGDEALHVLERLVLRATGSPLEDDEWEPVGLA